MNKQKVDPLNTALREVRLLIMFTSASGRQSSRNTPAAQLMRINYRRVLSNLYKHAVLRHLFEHTSTGASLVF